MKNKKAKGEMVNKKSKKQKKTDVSREGSIDDKYTDWRSRLKKDK